MVSKRSSWRSRRSWTRPNSSSINRVKRSRSVWAIDVQYSTTVWLRPDGTGHERPKSWHEAGLDADYQFGTPQSTLGDLDLPTLKNTIGPTLLTLSEAWRQFAAHAP